MKPIFNKKQAGTGWGRRQRPSAVAPSSAHGERTGDDQVSRESLAIDDSLVVLSRQLATLRQVRVPQSAKERGWAALERELERRPVRAAQAGGPGSPARSRRMRKGFMGWALGGAAVVIAVAATLVATLGGGPVTTVVENPTTVTSVVSTDTSLPGTTLPTTVSTDGSSSPTATQPSTTQPTAGTSTNGSANSGNTPNSPGTTHVTTQPSTTQPTSSPTTSGQQNAAQQRIRSAQDAAAALAQMVVSGNTSGVGSLVAPSAQAAFAQMVRSLSQPYDYSVEAGQMFSSYVVRVPLSVSDRVLNGQGELVETVKHFLVKVEVKGDSAVIIAINAGS